MEKRDYNSNALRPDEKRSRLMPVLIVIAGLFFFTAGFLIQQRPGGKSYSEYQFNNAVVTNNIDSLESKKTATPAIKKTDKNSKQPKTDKKGADFCPT